MSHRPDGPARLLAGGTLTLTVTDDDSQANSTNGPANDTVSVTVVCANTGDTETVVLTEPTTAGVFTATLPTAFGLTVAANGTLVCNGSDTATLTYVDPLRSNGNTSGIIVTDTATMRVGADAIVNVSPDPFAIGADSLMLYVGDDDVAVNDTVGAGNDVVIATMTCVNSGDTESVVLFESVTIEGVFEGTISTAGDTATAENGTLECVLTGDIATLTYVDPLRASGNATGLVVTNDAFGDGG